MGKEARLEAKRQILGRHEQKEQYRIGHEVEMRKFQQLKDEKI